MNFLKPSYRILEKYYLNKERGANLKLVLNRNLNSRDTLLNSGITRTVYGVVRHNFKLEAMVRHLSNRGSSKMDLATSISLKTALFLLFFSDSYAPHAVVNETVRAATFRSKSFVNAILRNSLRKEEKLKELFMSHEDPVINYSITADLVEAAQKLLPTNNLLEFLNLEPVFHLRPNPECIKYQDLEKELKKSGISYKKLEGFESFEINNPGPLIKSLISKNLCYIQNIGSQLISYIASEYGESIYLDICAAPGTKSITLKHLKNEVQITASDINPKRIKLLKSLCENSGFPINCMASDGLLPACKDEFDFIIVDAPCSSVGTCRKNPDLKTKITKKEIKENARIQLKIMEKTLEHYSSSEYILYSVCSFTPEETENIIHKLSLTHQFETCDISNFLKKYGINFKKADYGFYLLPDDKFNCDLFYFSLIKKTSP